MSFRYALALAALAMTLATLCPAQERIESGSLKGFTKSPTENINNELDIPFTVRTVSGIVLDRSGAEMDGVIVEIQDAAGRIRGTKTSSKGTFKLSGIPEGTYRFKVTMNGFQSVVGQIIVSKQASKADRIKIEMKVGV